MCVIPPHDHSHRVSRSCGKGDYCTATEARVDWEANDNTCRTWNTSAPVTRWTRRRQSHFPPVAASTSTSTSSVMLWLLLALPIPALAGIEKTRGVLPSFLSRYQSPGSDTALWSCLDNTKSIPWSAVNDDYCDCPDGSDEPGEQPWHSGQLPALSSTPRHWSMSDWVVLLPQRRSHWFPDPEYASERWVVWYECYPSVRWITFSHCTVSKSLNAVTAQTSDQACARTSARK